MDTSSKRFSMKPWAMSLLACLLLLGCAYPVGYPVAPNSDFQVIDNVDSPGGDFSSVVNTNFSDCQSMCSSNSKCVAFEFNKVSKSCWLKDRIQDTVRNTDGTLGVKMITLEFDIDRPGGDYRSLTTASVQQCRQVCTQEGPCRAFTYNRVSSLCWLKDNIPNTVSSTQGISGRK
jgi:hypothetical protein